MNPLMAIRRGLLLSLALSCLTGVAGSTPWEPSSNESAAPPSEFQFIRLIYDTHPQWGGWRRTSWYTDAPAAETHLLEGIRRLTRVDTAAEGKALRALDPRLFDYPFIYAVEVGHWSLSDEEAQRLREYLLRGGFLMVDDFHGTVEWSCFLESMQRVFPDRPIIDLPEDAEIFHVLYAVDQRTQIPNVWGAAHGQSWEKDGYTPHWRGIYDDDGRLMVSINFNMDLGDAWEHADNPLYPEPLTLLAYHFAIDYLLYAMTH